MALICRAEVYGTARRTKPLSRIIPGINVAIPSTPEDAAGLLWTAMHCEDPTFVLIPKHLLWAEHESTEPVRAVPLGRGAKAQQRLRCHARRLGQHGRKIARSAGGNRRRNQRRSDRSSFDRSLGPRRHRGIGRAARAGWSSCRKTARIAVSAR